MIPPSTVRHRWMPEASLKPTSSTPLEPSKAVVHVVLAGSGCGRHGGMTDSTGDHSSSRNAITRFADRKLAPDAAMLM
jgi:hypothetical protein